MVPEKITEEFALPRITELIESIRQNLPELFDPAILTRKSKTPYLGFTAREILIRRVYDLASGAMLLHESRNVVGSCVLIRALIETVALSYLALKNTQLYPKDKTAEQLHEFYVGILLGG